MSNPKQIRQPSRVKFPLRGESKSCAPAVISLQQLKMSRSFSFLWPLILSPSLSLHMEHTYSRKTGVNPCAVNLFYFFNSREGERERERETTLFQFWRNGAGGKRKIISTAQHEKKKKHREIKRRKTKM